MTRGVYPLPPTLSTTIAGGRDPISLVEARGVLVVCLPRGKEVNTHHLISTYVPFVEAQGGSSNPP
jgi:hypothetical protein